MKSLDLKKADFLANEIEYLNSYALSSGAAYFPPPIAANLSLDKIGYTSGLISKIDSEQRVATLMNGVLEKKRQEAYEAVKQYLESDRQAIIEAANTRLDLKSILENGRQAIIEAASLDLIPNTIHHYRPNSRRIGTQQPIKRPKTQENPNSYAKPSNTFEAKSKPEKPLSVDHSRLKRIAEHEKRYADLKNNVHPIMEIRQIVLLLIPELDANQEREALAKAIIQSIQHGYLEFNWFQGKESFIYRPFHEQVVAAIHIEKFTTCANAGWLGDDAPAMALQWHAFIKKTKAALPAMEKEKKLSILEQRVPVVCKVLRDRGFDPLTFEPGLETMTHEKFYETCLLEDEEAFKGILHPKCSESFRIEVWSKVKKYLVKKNNKILP